MLGDEEQEVSLARTLDALSLLIPISDRQRDRVVREVARRRNFVPVTVVEILPGKNSAGSMCGRPICPG